MTGQPGSVRRGLLQRRFKIAVWLGACIAVISCLAVTGLLLTKAYRQELNDQNHILRMAVFSVGQLATVASDYVNRLDAAVQNLQTSELPDDLRPFLGRSGALYDSSPEAFTRKYGVLYNLSTLPATESVLKHSILSQVMALTHVTRPAFQWSYYYDAERRFFTIYPKLPLKELYATTRMNTPDRMIMEFFVLGGTDPVGLAASGQNPKRNMLWTPPYDDAGGKGLMVSLLKPVYIADRFTGVVGTDFTLSMLDSVIANFADSGMNILIVDKTGALIASTSKQFTPGKPLETALPKLFQPGITREHGSFWLKEQIPGTAWSCIGQIPSGYLAKKLGIALLPVFIFCLVWTVAAILLIRWLYRSISLPVLQLVEHIEAAGNGIPRVPDSAPAIWRDWFVRISEVAEQRSSYLESLQQNERNYRELVEHANSIIIRWDTDGRILFFNEFAEKTFGFTRDEVAGKNLVGTIVPETKGNGHDLQAMIRDIVNNPEKYLHNEHENITRSGERIYVSWANKALFDAEGQLSELLSVGQDITEKRMLEVQLLQQQKLEGIGMLAGGMAHDINNLLTPIFIWSEMATRKLGADHAVQKHISAITTAANKIKDLVAQVLLFSRKQHAALKPVAINPLVSDFMEMLKRTIRENITLDFTPDQDAGNIMADSTQLEQILMNLVVNAQDAIHSAGTITVKTGRMLCDEAFCRNHPGAAPGSYVILSCTDSGCGMDATTAAKIFEPFFTTKEQGKGTGLGLSTVYGIMRQHGGFMEVQSVVGEGTVFVLYFPAHLEPEETGSAGVDGGQTVHHSFSGTLLVVEDNDMLRESIIELLIQNRISTVAAATPGAALELFRQRQGEITLLLTDVVMPDMSGPELYARIQELQADLPVLYMSGYDSDSERAALWENSPEIFLKKPFTMQELFNKIEYLYCKLAKITVL